MLVLVIIVAIVAGGVGYFGQGLLTGRKVAERTATHADQKKTMYNCPMHPNYISDKPGSCPICGMDLVPMKTNGAASSDSGIRIDPNTVHNMGVKTETAEVRNLTREIRASGTVAVNEKTVSVVTGRVTGYVEKLHVDYTGQNVRKDQPLMELYSPELVSTQDEYLQALRYLKKLSPDSDARARQGAADLVESAKRRFLNWEISASAIETLEQSGTPSRTMSILAPASGVVLDKMVVKGQNIMPGMELYRIADLSTVWVIASVYQDDLPFLRTGMTADIELQSSPGKTYTGRVSFISPVLDPDSKTVSVRLEVPNTADNALKPNMFASVKIVSPVAFNAVAVPDQSIIRSGKRNILIVAIGNGYFRPVDVVLGVSANGYVQVIDGIKAGQTIVTSSQFLIDSESNLKAAAEQMSMGTPASSGDVPPINTQHSALRPQESCPIMGEPINKKLYVDQDGKRIFVCCPGCIPKVRANFAVCESKLASIGEAVEIINK